MYILLQGHDYRYEISEFLKLFSSEFSFIECSEDFGVNREEEVLVNKLDIDYSDDRVKIATVSQVYKGDKVIYEKELSDKLLIADVLGPYDGGLEYEKKFAKRKRKIDNNIKTISKRLIQRSMFDYLNEKYDANVPWGILTGIRPVKLIHSLMDKGKNDQEIADFMKDEYLISQEKLDLIMDIAKRERPFIYPTSEKKISLYLSIPFCPTRCLYCSFPSHSLDRYGQHRSAYVETLLKEARGIKSIIEDFDKEIESLYIGGGTPTSLDAGDMDYLISNIFEILDLSHIKEFTVEAGRPDTITREKLEVLKKHGVTRISINPQTMNQASLDRIGRRHSVEDIVDCYQMARDLGFDNINMDLILGLPGETPAMVEETMKKIVDLDPESVTVHTLALKRASDLNINLEDHKNDLSNYRNMVEMIDISRKYMDENGYKPYYMYRQKHMMGNLENIGYAKPGYECLYNMQIMEEKQSNYAIGAGAVSKFVYLDENRIERVDDVKSLEHYLARIDEMIDKKYKEVAKNVDKSTKRN